MNNSFTNKFLSTLTALIISCAGYSQQIVVKATADKNRILIGEPLTLTLEVMIPPKAKPGFFVIDTIPHFEFLNEGTIDTLRGENATILKQSLIITSFDSGRWVIPAFVPKGYRTKTDTFGIHVDFATFDRSKDYNDVKEIKDVEPAKEKQNWLWYILAGALVLATIAYFIFRKKPKGEVKTTPAIDPYQEAMNDLDKLRKQSSKGDSKAYYTKLAEILRTYLSKRKNIESYQKTTDDLVLQLRSLSLPDDEFNKLAQALRLTDFVKFAKYQPSAEEDIFALETVKSAIEQIEKTGKK